MSNTFNAPQMSNSMRQQIYILLIVISAAVIFGKIVAVDNIADRTIQNTRLAQIPNRLAEKQKKLEKEGVSGERLKQVLRQTARDLLADAQKERPTLSANDRSRWLTIRALVEPESRVYRYIPVEFATEKKIPSNVILRNCSCQCPQNFETNRKSGQKYYKQLVPYAIDKAMENPGWDTIDMVKHGLPDEEYAPQNPYSGYLFSSKPTLLPTVMAVPYWILNRTFGLSLVKQPFLTARILLVLINLIPLILAWLAAASIIDYFGTKDWSRIFAMTVFCFGTFVSTFAVTLNNHLPAVVSITFAIYGAFRILYWSEERSWFWFAFTGFFGAFAVACELPALAVTAAICAVLIVKFPKKTLLYSIPIGLLVAVAFFGTNYIAHNTLKPAYAQKRDHMALALANRETQKMVDGQTAEAIVPSFDQNDWYIYNYFPAGRVRIPQNTQLAYWANRIGIDRGEPNQWIYLFHATLGHHGLFSLTPVWLLSFIGMFFLIRRRNMSTNGKRFALLVLGLTLIFFVFYMTRDQGDRNYGGMTCGLRWFFPLIPLWIPIMLPALDKIACSRFGRGTALTLLFFSIMSMTYPIWNPWSHPWLYQLMFQLGWLGAF